MDRRLPLPLFLLACLLLIPSARIAGQGKPAPRISFEEDAIVASGLTAGGKAVWFGVERRVDEEYSIEIARRYDEVPVAAGGTARLELSRPASPVSLWVAVDLASGEYALAAPPEGRPVSRSGKPPRLGEGQGGQPDGIVDERPYVFGLVVRPGEGAWSFAGGDGGDQDGDGKVNGRSFFALDKLAPLPGVPGNSAAPPSKARGDDLWIAVDPLKMEISVNRGGVAQ